MELSLRIHTRMHTTTQDTLPSPLVCPLTSHQINKQIGCGFVPFQPLFAPLGVPDDWLGKCSAACVCVCGCERDSLVASVSLTAQNKAAALMLPSLPSLLNPPGANSRQTIFFFFFPEPILMNRFVKLLASPTSWGRGSREGGRAASLVSKQTASS